MPLAKLVSVARGDVQGHTIAALKVHCVVTPLESQLFQPHAIYFPRPLLPTTTLKVVGRVPNA